MDTTHNATIIPNVIASCCNATKNPRTCLGATSALYLEGTRAVNSWRHCVAVFVFGCLCE
jgi:hypothetical protein